ncbi:MAG: ABC transporter substrate-binding protein [Massiliimalia sp.]|jgi:lactose/L-arabinose transport system substrate-binding protein
MKRTVSVLLSGLLLFSAVSCGEKPVLEESKPESNVTSQSESSELETPKEPENPSKVIRLAYGYEGNPQREVMKTWLEQSAHTWEYNGVTIELEQVKYSGDEGQAAILSARKAGQTPPDITLLRSVDLVAFLYGNYGSFYQPIDRYLSNYPQWEDGSFYPIAQEFCRHQGKTYGVPFSMYSYGILWYRKDILEQAGITDFAPKTWEEFLEYLKVIQKNCPGVLPIWYDNNPNMFSSVLYANGGSFCSEDGKFLTGSEAIEQSLNCYSDLKELGIEPEEDDYTEYSFEQGNLAIQLTSSRLYGQYLTDDTEALPEYYSNLDFVPIPPREGMESETPCDVNGECFVVTYESGNPRAAVDFIMHCMKPENYGPAICRMKTVSVCPEVVQQEEYQKLELKSRQTTMIADGKINELNGEHIRHFHSVWDMIKRVVDDGMVPKDAMEQFCEDMNLYFKEDELSKE